MPRADPDALIPNATNLLTSRTVAKGHLPEELVPQLEIAPEQLAELDAAIAAAA